MKNKEIIETEIKNYTSKLRKNRGEVVSIEVKTMGDYVPNALNPDFIIGGFVEFSGGDKIFVYRFDNEVNNYENGKGYRTYSSYNKESRVKTVVSGWDRMEKYEALQRV
jgi:hypothetical protein